MERAVISSAIWPVFVCAGLLWAIAATPLFAAAGQPDQSPERVSTLDGLRGFLALAVFFHHGAFYQSFITAGVWDSPFHFFRCIGPYGVMMFFMTTGYLFWSKLLRADGRANWRALYIGRVFRIGPVYLVAVAAVLVLVFTITGLQLQASPKDLAVSLVKWLALGLFIPPDVNGVPRTQLWLAGVTWSLRFEWLFYASLPVLALLARSRRWRRPAVLAVLAAALAWAALGGPYVYDSPRRILPLFLIGMACAASPARPWMRGWMGSALALAAIAVAFAAPDPLAMLPVIALGVAFWMVVAGASLFGLLRTPAAVRLGDISYGLYMLQGLALAAAFRPAPLQAFALGGPVQYWLLEAAAAILLVLLALAVHVAVERPGIALGKRIALRWARPSLV